jgi:hypothetical protein
MLWFKRLATGCVTWPILFVVFWVGSLLVGGGIVGGIAGAKNPENAPQAGAEAGREFGEKYGIVITIGAFALSLAGAVGVCALVPWCKREELPVVDDGQGLPGFYDDPDNVGGADKSVL